MQKNNFFLVNKNQPFFTFCLAQRSKLKSAKFAVNSINLLSQRAQLKGKSEIINKEVAQKNKQKTNAKIPQVIFHKNKIKLSHTQTHHQTKKQNFATIFYFIIFKQDAALLQS